MTSTRGLCVALMVLGACGRLDFDLSARDGGDAGADAGLDAPACALGPWGAPRHQANLATIGNEWEGTIHPNRLLVVFTRQNGPSDLMIAKRARTDQDFDTPTLFSLDSPGTDHDFGAAWSPDGKQLYWRHLSNGPVVNEVLMADFDGTSFTNRRTVTAFPDGFSWELTPDGRENFYTTQPGVQDYDLHHATLQGGAWVEDPATLFHTTGAEGWPAFDAARQTLYFEQQPPAATARLFQATRAGPGSAFGPSSPVDVGVMDTGNPDLSDDGRELMFDSTAATVPGDYDLFVTTRSCQ